MNAQRKALEKLWKDRCTIIQRVEVTDPDTKLTDSQEIPLVEDQPCKLSFEALTSTDGDPVATTAQGVKLFLSPDIEIPAGCKVIVTRQNDLERVFTFSSSGVPGVFRNHQEIPLKLFERWS